MEHLHIEALHVNSHEHRGCFWCMFGIQEPLLIPIQSLCSCWRCLYFSVKRCPLCVHLTHHQASVTCHTLPLHVSVGSKAIRNKCTKEEKPGDKATSSFIWIVTLFFYANFCTKNACLHAFAIVYTMPLLSSTMTISEGIFSSCVHFKIYAVALESAKFL